MTHEPTMNVDTAERPVAAQLAADLLRWPDELRPYSKAAFAGKLALGVVVGLAATPVILNFIDTTDRLGPHRVIIRTTNDSAATVDVGPLGAVRSALKTPLGIGANIEVKETKSSDKALLNEYVQLAAIMQRPDGEVAHLTELVTQQIGKAAGLGILGGEMAVFGAAMLYKRAYRETKPTPWKVAVALATSASILTTAGVRLTHEDPSLAPDDWRLISNIIGPKDTRLLPLQLQNVQVRGSLLTESIQGGWGFVKEKFINSRTFYANLETEFSAVQVAPKQPNEVRIITISDRHGNIAADALVKAALIKSQADILIDLGDDTSSGSAVEAYSINSLVDATKDIDAKYFVFGNHDAPETSSILKKHGFNELTADKAVTVKGIRLLGGADPRHSDLAMAMKQGEQNISELSSQLADAACADTDGLDILVTHDPEAGDDTARRGCADITIAGHLHTQKGPTLQTNADGSSVYRFVNGTTGGALSALSIGPFSNKADITMLSFLKDDNDSAHFAGSQDFRFSKQGAVVNLPFEPASPVASRRDISVSQTEPAQYDNKLQRMNKG